MSAFLDHGPILSCTFCFKLNASVVNGHLVCGSAYCLHKAMETPPPPTGTVKV